MERPYNIEIDMLLTLGECRKNYREAEQLWAVRFPGIPKSHMAFKRLEVRGRSTGSLRNKKRVRRQTKTNDDMAIGVLGAVAINPHVGSRELAIASGMCQKSVLTILKKHNFHPYHLSLHQELYGLDFQNRITFCNWLRLAVRENNVFLSNIIFSDEATFTNCVQVNRHNLHYWAPQNPHWLRCLPNQHPWSVNTWCGIVGDRVIGPHFFDRHLNGEMYNAFLRNDLPQLLGNNENRQELWFQHDGAPPHFARQARTTLNEIFGIRWIGRGGPVNWPARSPDLTPLDFFLWGFIKDKVMATPPTTPENMKNRIREACNLVTPQMLYRVRSSCQKRIAKCLEVNGHHFEHLLKHVNR